MLGGGRLAQESVLRTPARTPRGTRTHNTGGLSALPLPIGLEGHKVVTVGVEPTTTGLQSVVLPLTPHDRIRRECLYTRIHYGNLGNRTRISFSTN